MTRGRYQAFANRLINVLKERGYTASRSPNGICIRSLSQFTDASEQICRRYIRGEALPDYDKIKKIAERLEVNPGWLLFGEEGHPIQSKETIDENLLRYILKESHQLYKERHGDSDNFAEFVLGLIEQVKSIDTTEENLLRIIDLAIRSINAYGQTKQAQSC